MKATPVQQPKGQHIKATQLEQELEKAKKVFDQDTFLLEELKTQYSKLQNRNEILEQELAKAKKENKQIEQEMVVEVSKLATKHIPAPVLACSKEFGDYLGVSNAAVVRHLCTNSDGTTYTSGWIDSLTNIPIPHSCSYITVKDEDYAIVESIETRRKNMVCEKADFRDKVYSALLSLRTVKKVEEEFPEALKYLVIPEEKQLPSPVLTDIRSIISQVD